jgi:hypothetical protein
MRSRLRLAVDGTRKSTSAARSGPTKLTPRPLIPMPCSTAPVAVHGIAESDAALAISYMLRLIDVCL